VFHRPQAEPAADGVFANCSTAPRPTPAHPLGGLVALLAERIREYEARVHPWPVEATPAQVLAALMAEHGLTQSQLPEVGAQSVVSAVLAGKPRLNLRQVQALSARFAVPMEVFAG
jgi:HTH-type transcriptional regulator/antitoxin HigA